uniref:Uncharacterized protein n=1 Tax=Eutreptiella gymnastica TaxID=73025 RepID=A0A7S4CYR4_9EUGL
MSSEEWGTLAFRGLRDLPEGPPERRIIGPRLSRGFCGIGPRPRCSDALATIHSDVPLDGRPGMDPPATRKRDQERRSSGVATDKKLRGSVGDEGRVSGPGPLRIH